MKSMLLSLHRNRWVKSNIKMCLIHKPNVRELSATKSIALNKSMDESRELRLFTREEKTDCVRGVESRLLESDPC